MTLQTVWFCVIAALWGGYFVLEGFDFGVGALLPVLPRDESERQMMFDSIGPVWDGNEVWLVTVGGATFAAFPLWYATMFSGFYLALLLVLVCLIVRAVSFEWRSKSKSPRWRAIWQWANTAGSVGAPFVWGVALSSILHGVPLNASHGFVGSFWDLFSVYTILGGVVCVGLFSFHGANYLTFRTGADLSRRARDAAQRLAAPVVVGCAGFLAWTVVIAVEQNHRGVFAPILPAALSGGALVLATIFVGGRKSGWAFSMTAASTFLLVATLFTSLYPRVLVSVPNFANSLTTTNASSSHYALSVISIAALILVPIVLLYQGWTYYVFRARITGAPVTTPIDALSSGSDSQSSA